jgi:hypothetical protein
MREDAAAHRPFIAALVVSKRRLIYQADDSSNARVILDDSAASILKRTAFMRASSRKHNSIGPTSRRAILNEARERASSASQSPRCCLRERSRYVAEQGHRRHGKAEQRRRELGADRGPPAQSGTCSASSADGAPDFADIDAEDRRAIGHDQPIACGV